MYSLLSIVMVAQNIKIHPDTALTIGYFINEILKYIELLSSDISPRLGPALRVIEKLITSSQKSFS